MHILQCGSERKVAGYAPLRKEKPKKERQKKTINHQNQELAWSYPINKGRVRKLGEDSRNQPDRE